MPVKTRSNAATVASELKSSVALLVRRLRAEASFPYTQIVVLGRLDREGPRSVSDLASAEHMRPQSMAQTIKEMEADGLVSRRPDPDDGRRSLVELTSDGLERLEAERRDRLGWLAAAIAELETPEREALVAALPVIHRIAESEAPARR